MSDDQTAAEDQYVNAIGEHVVKHIGPVTNVFHEKVPELVHVDLLVIEPHEGRPFTTIVTCGMSELSMRVPIENPEDLGLIPELRFAELLLALPPEWPLTPEAFHDEANYWPLRWLKMLARLPHQTGGWLGLGHTIPNGDPPRPLAPDVPFAGWLIDEPVLLPREVLKLRHSDRVINFYSVVPLYEGEMNLKLRKGGSALAQLLDRAQVSERIDVTRADVAAIG
ncbi:MAG TPA: suppressor of fused domain protein [Gemmataceae bacterium]|nr:suppressor of fused domain protein [Gemmataceae bacterium]